MKKRRPGFRRYRRELPMPTAVVVPNPFFRGERLTQEEVFSCICPMVGGIDPSCPIRGKHLPDSTEEERNLE